ncbi:PepSY domain-containing protein [Methylomonas sp. SURF-1]|uniref:PepSY domain-containing protein n=1 Tax=Methylomonas aurea TaxID=2952224 RepID=A0ABT1UPP8_9GAMM|nr:PepSY domain-containing protein [Methylomonas sp. SURF-1]MCQ8183635.1 PepSY domain-containing protein [Methylomonas sp. SURF-1]
MKKISVKTAVMAGLGLLSLGAIAADQGLESCIQAVKKEKSGDLVKLEKLNVAGKGAYELELRDNNRQEWEFICDADSGKLTERESEVADPNSQAFKKNVKVTEEDAAATALKANPGTIEEVEYEVEENGAASYEFDIVNDKGVETKIEVDATSGKIIETATEEWEIGEEADERR